MIEEQFGQAELQRVMDEYPDLTALGWGPGSYVNRRHSAEERAALIVQGRAELLGLVDQVAFCRVWILVNLEVTARVGRHAPGSYYLKHLAEKDAHDVGCYVTNGALLAAALSIPGVKHEQVGINSRLSFSRESVEAVVKRQTMPIVSA